MKSYIHFLKRLFCSLFLILPGLIPALAGENPKLTNPYLYPPLNFVVESMETTPYLFWQKPQLPDGTEPPGLTGFRICRNGQNIKNFNNTDTLYWYDFDQQCVDRIYYTINAVYDLTPYGQPGETGYSLQAGPDSLDPQYCPPPFIEGWVQGSFTFNDWKFQPSQGNWMINTTEGDPFPSACFTGVPVVNNYNYSIISRFQDAVPYTCADWFLDFDYKLSQVQPSTSDFLTVEINRGGDLWEMVEEYVNSENTGWVHKNIQLPDAGGMIFRVRFRAHGDNSATIDSWCLDNLSMYEVCHAAYLSGSAGNDAVTLTWIPPVCPGTGTAQWRSYDDESAESYYGGEAFQNRWFGNKFSIGSTGPVMINDITAYFGNAPEHGTDLAVFEIFNEDHIKIATSRPFIPPDNGWISVTKEFMIPQQDSVFVMVHYMAPVHVSNPVGYDANGSVSSDELAWVYDGTSWMKATTYGAAVGCFLVRLNATSESDSPDRIISSSHADIMNTTVESTLMGYNIYRSDSAGSGPYVKLNAALCTDTLYVDHFPPGMHGKYCYYVTSVFYWMNNPACESSGDTVCFDIPLGLNKITESHVKIFPNPVTDDLIIESDRMIDKTELFDCFGRIVLEENRIPGKSAHISFSDLPQGVYILKLVCSGEVTTRKVLKQ